MKARTLRFSWSIVVGAVAVIVSMELLREAALAQEAPFLSMGSATFVGVDLPMNSLV